MQSNQLRFHMYNTISTLKTNKTEQQMMCWCVFRLGIMVRKYYEPGTRTILSLKIRLTHKISIESTTNIHTFEPNVKTNFFSLPSLGLYNVHVYQFHGLQLVIFVFDKFEMSLLPLALSLFIQ